MFRNAKVTISLWDGLQQFCCEMDTLPCGKRSRGRLAQLAEDLVCSFFKNQPGELGLVTNVRTDCRCQLKLLPLNPKRQASKGKDFLFHFWRESTLS